MLRKFAETKQKQRDRVRRQGELKWGNSRNWVILLNGQGAQARLPSVILN